MQIPLRFGLGQLGLMSAATLLCAIDAPSQTASAGETEDTVWLANRQHQGADFRLWAQEDDLRVRRVEVRTTEQPGQGQMRCSPGPPRL